MEEKYKPLTKKEANQLEGQFINEPLYRALRGWLSSLYEEYKYQFPAEIWKTAKGICYRMGGSSYPATILVMEYDNLITDYDFYNEKYKFGYVKPHDEYAANLVLECCYFMIACSCSTTKEMRSNLMNFIDDKLDDWKEDFRKDFVNNYKAAGEEKFKIDYLKQHEEQTDNVIDETKQNEVDDHNTLKSTVTFERKDKQGNSLTKSITARTVSDIVMKYPWKTGMTKEQMQKMLAEITGMSEASFHKRLVE